MAAFRFSFTRRQRTDYLRTLKVHVIKPHNFIKNNVARATETADSDEKAGRPGVGGATL